MINVQIKGNVNFPNIDFTNELDEIAKAIFIPILQSNIHAGRDIQEQPYPPLADSTIKRKKDNRPLIETGKLVRSFFDFKKGKNTIVISLNADRIKVGDILQNQGVRSKRYGLRFFNFFGVSTRMESQAMRFMKRKIKEYIDDAGR